MDFHAIMSAHGNLDLSKVEIWKVKIAPWHHGHPCGLPPHNDPPSTTRCEHPSRSPSCATRSPGHPQTRIPPVLHEHHCRLWPCSNQTSTTHCEHPCSDGSIVFLPLHPSHFNIPLAVRMVDFLSYLLVFRSLGFYDAAPCRYPSASTSTIMYLLQLCIQCPFLILSISLWCK